MRQEAWLKKQKKTQLNKPRLCVRNVCRVTHPVMHMPCKKPRPQGVCLTPGQGKREQKKCCEFVFEGVHTQSRWYMLHITPQYDNMVQYNTLVKQSLTSITCQWYQQSLSNWSFNYQIFRWVHNVKCSVRLPVFPLMGSFVCSYCNLY